MNSLEFSFVFFILVPHSFGRCFDMSFSVCWVGKENALDRPNENVWLNGTSIRSIMTAGRLASLTVPPVVENRLALQHRGFIQRWTFSISPRTKVIKITGRQKPSERPTNSTQSFLKSLDPTEVFACEEGTAFLHQEENFFLAVGHTFRFPIKLESRSTSALLVSWVDTSPDEPHFRSVTLFHRELGSYSPLAADSTTLKHHRFTALQACSSYVVCVETAGSHSFSCLSTITDPEVPKHLEVRSWNSSSITLSWDCPENLKYSLFLLTVFHLDGTGRVTEEVESWLTDDSLTVTLSELPPCVRLRFGLQTVCQAGLESRFSRMVLSDGNSDYSSIDSLTLAAFGPSSYTLSWQVKNTSSISMFRVYHQGALQATTLLTQYSVGGLLPCQTYQAKVEALCGDNVLMSVRKVTAHTGPGGVSELRYRSNDSTVVWTPSVPNQPAVAFVYELSLRNGSTVETSRVSNMELPLPWLQPGRSYILKVWAECDGQRRSVPSQLSFKGANLSVEIHVRAAEPPQNPGPQLDFDNVALMMVVPWSLPEDVQDDSSESSSKMKQIFKNKLQELLKDFDQPVRVQLDSFEPADEPSRTRVLFRSFDGSNKDDLVLPIDDQLNHISVLNPPNIAVRNSIIHWEGPDVCVSQQPVCPPHSLCINTLGSHMCVCQRGYYDVSSVIDPASASRPLCKDKGLFNQCLDKVMTGGIAKSYLTSLFGGSVEVKLNDGRCSVNDSELLYYFNTPRRSSECGTESQVNDTHILLQNTLMVSLTKEHRITRRDLRVVWKCIYPRRYVRNTQVVANMEWLSSVTVVEFNSSLLLGLAMTLYTDESYTSRYSDVIELGFEDSLFFQVALQSNGSFASDVLLQVESCWATESPDPSDTVQAAFLQEGCPLDDTFHWLSVNGGAQRSWFSVQMFRMPKGLPLYFHCLTNICGHHEACTKNCSSQQRLKRSVRKGKPAAVVSAGPLTVSTRGKSVRPSYWTEHPSVIGIVATSVSFLGMIVLAVCAVKAVMKYYEQLRLQ
ncbi:uncharacterized protein LOC108249374 [Kryptolebias marmoratus]|uniref:uncharacterized protein LOC108249374 n=1 Tax=Kryptolebias marmoratus TaxID=37003 RepID=UPI000D52F21A|nr:uncharacterized protein LOC108249374 [Kryptolebias marmoratus]